MNLDKDPSARFYEIKRRELGIRSDNGSEFISRAAQKWIEKVGVQTLYIAPGSPWENGYVESFNSELLNRELFLSITELRYVVDQ